MSEDNPEVGKEQPGDAQSIPMSGPPADGQVAINSKDWLELQKTVQSLTGKVGNLLQDQKGNSNAIQEHSKILAEYKGLIAKGLSPEAAEAAMGQAREQQSLADQLTDMRKTLDFLAQRNGMAVTNPDVAALVTKYQLDPNSPEVTRVLATGKQGDALRAELADLALAKASRPAPAPSAAPAQNAPAPAPAGLSDDEKARKYAELNEAYKRPTQNVAQIKKLEAELGL